MTEVPEEKPGTEEPVILERLSDLRNQADYVSHYPDIRGWLVINPMDDEVGVVDDLYVNPRNHRVMMAVICFNACDGYTGKKVIVPVEVLRISGNRVRLLTHSEKIQAAPEFHEGIPSYESYYEYWSSVPDDYEEELAKKETCPPGRLELAEYDELDE